MRMRIETDRLRLFRSLFRGRTDVYALRWESASGKGYMPARKPDSSSEYALLTDEVIAAHLAGEITVGIYPMLLDHSVYFAALDFDGKGWENACKTVHSFLERYGLSSYIERSRSGNGGHVWLFFPARIPAVTIRSLLRKMLEQAFANQGNKALKSFDRIFPNQDFLSGKSFGNLIALPLQGISAKSGNSVFIDPFSQAALSDQWTFLRNIRKIRPQEIIRTFNALYVDVPSNSSPKPKDSILHILVESQILLSKSHLPNSLWEGIKGRLTVANPLYFIRKNAGKSVYGIEKYRSLIRQDGDTISLPVVQLRPLLEQLEMEAVRFQVQDNRILHSPIQFNPKIELWPSQGPAIESIQNAFCGVVVAPPGSGKTVVALKAIAIKGRKSLIIVHRRDLMEQWISRIEEFLGIPRSDIGILAGPKCSIGDQVTIGMVQTLARSRKLPQDWSRAFGTAIVDECHHVPAQQYQKVIGLLDCEFIFGFTATPIRKVKDEKFIFALLGPLLAHLKPSENQLDFDLSMQIRVRNTELFADFNAKKDEFPALMNILINDPRRNTLIQGDIEAAVKGGKKCLVLSERKKQLQLLQTAVRCNSISMTGDLSQNLKSDVRNRIETGDFEVVFATGQLFGEGIDIPAFDILFLVYPIAFAGKLIQYVGRVKRDGKRPEIIDYRDLKVPILERMYRKRLKVYRGYFGG